MREWRRSEPRDVRPFFGARPLEEALDGAAIAMRPREDPIADESVALQLGDLDDDEVTLFPRLSNEAVLSTLGDRAESYALVVTLRDPTFKRRALWGTWSAAGEMPETILISAETLREFGHGREVEIALSLCLTADRDPEPGWPSTTGGWIARKKFSIGVHTQRSAFDIRPLTEEIRKANKLPDGALVFASLGGVPLDERVEEGEAFAVCYLAESVLAAMSSSREGSALNLVIGAEMVAAVVSAIAEEGNLAELEAVEPGTPLERFLRQLGGEEPMSLDRFRRLVDDPQRMRATIHDRIGVVAGLEKL